MAAPNEHDRRDDLDDGGDSGVFEKPQSSIDLMACPFCQKSCSELADVCPHCHNFIGSEPHLIRKAWWVWLGAILALLATLPWVLAWF